LQLKHEYVGTEHVLHVLCRDDWPWAPALVANGLTGERVLEYLRRWDVNSTKSKPPLPLSPNLKCRLGSVMALTMPDEPEELTGYRLLFEIVGEQDPRPRGPIMEYCNVDVQRLIKSIATPE
jgi:hypothetical protein